MGAKLYIHTESEYASRFSHNGTSVHSESELWFMQQMVGPHSRDWLIDASLSDIFCQVNHTVWKVHSTCNSLRWFLRGLSSCTRGREAWRRPRPGKYWGSSGTSQSQPRQALNSATASVGCLWVSPRRLQGWSLLLKTMHTLLIKVLNSKMLFIFLMDPCGLNGHENIIVYNGDFTSHLYIYLMFLTSFFIYILAYLFLSYLFLNLFTIST